MGAATPLRAPRVLARRLASLAPRVLLLAAASSCVPLGGPVRGTSSARPMGPTPHITDAMCEPDATPWITVATGTAPLLVVSTHAGERAPAACAPDGVHGRPLRPRACSGALDAACASGPCRAAGPDPGARSLTLALVEELDRCLGARPSLVMSEVDRRYLDLNRDPADPGGVACALGEPAAHPLWTSFHRAVDHQVAEAVRLGGARALVLDVHTYGTLPRAPAPAVILGAGAPFGATLPRMAAEDPELDAIFGPRGLRAALLARAPTATGMQVLPARLDAPLDGLFAGRVVIHRIAAGQEVDAGRSQAGSAEFGPPRRGVDALQIEVSGGLRDDTGATARMLASAICASLGARLRPRRSRRRLGRSSSGTHERRCGGRRGRASRRARRRAG